MSEIHLVIPGLSPDRPPAQRQEAARLVLAFLRDNRAPVVLGRYPASVRDEAVSRTIFKVIQRCSDSAWVATLASRPDVARFYLDQMLRRAAIDQVSPKREGKRDPETLASLQHELEQGAPPNPEQERIASDLEVERRGRIEKYRRRLRSVAEGTIEQRRVRDQGAARVAWRQIEALVFDGHSMPAVLREDEGVEEGSEAEAIVRARNRVLANHSRFRKAMFNTVDRWEEEGRLGEVAAAQTRLAIGFLFRCQRQDPPDVFPMTMEEQPLMEHPNGQEQAER